VAQKHLYSAFTSSGLCLTAILCCFSLCVSTLSLTISLIAEWWQSRHMTWWREPLSLHRAQRRQERRTLVLAGGPSQPVPRYTCVPNSWKISQCDAPFWVSYCLRSSCGAFEICWLRLIKFSKERKKERHIFTFPNLIVTGGLSAMALKELSFKSRFFHSWANPLYDMDTNWCSVDFYFNLLLQWTFLGLRMEEWPPAIEVSCEYIE
jgi:hypothetical protein